MNKFSLLFFMSLVTQISLSQSISKIEGVVINELNNEPIEFATVQILNLNIGTHTNSKGEFSFNQELPANIQLKITASFFEAQIIDINTDTNIVVSLQEVHLDLDEVIVSSPGGGTQRDNAFNIDRLSLKKTELIFSSDPAERLTNINGVERASLGPGISKPVIRGLQGLRIITLVDNVRIENQQWGADHGMGVNELGIGAIEVIKGPSSLLYGSDAMGGIVHFISDELPFVHHQKISASSSFESANLSTKNTLSYAVSGKQIRFRANGIYQNSADYRLPNNQFVKNSRFLQYGGKASLSINRKNWMTNVHASYSNFEVGIPGHTHDSVIIKEDFISDKQLRAKSLPLQVSKNLLLSVENKILIKKDILRIIVSNTNNKLNEFEEKWTVPGISLNLNTSAISTIYKQQISKSWRVIYGTQSVYQINKNSPLASERLINNFSQLDNGVYSIAYFTSKKKTKIQFGGRLDYRVLMIPSENFDNNFTSPNLSFGIVQPVKKSLYKINISTGFRAPHVSELFSDGIHHGSLRYEIGDKKLNSEKAMQFDFTYERNGEHLRLVFNPYYNLIQDYISLAQSDSIINGFNVYNYKQTDLSHLYGFDFGIHYHPHFLHNLHFETSFSYVRAEAINGENFDLIPQPKWRNTLKWEFDKNRSFYIQDISIQHQYFLNQNSTGINESSSVDYHLLHAGINMKYVKNMNLTISLGVKNILNTQYVNHLSRLKPFGINDVSRNYYIKINYTFQSRINNYK